ncbi:DODA-type extradiol aromatic ring-opening family dioxygenase [Phenylobacterium sp.]|jgi:aromatic ring-opening dioxygenase catalytic subunit (LigB family)|uniref:DODA-type extradiol aromatic ring-opening family dioxygenase n=1 Tax=Phenylobacterium sp. TaxID=1871053 RepID=UPI003783FE68
MRQPTFFIPHGAGPCFFMDWTRGPADTWDKTAAWLKSLVVDLPEPPRAVLVVSGHWEAGAFTVGAAERPELIFDYRGFPEHTYRLEFDPPGSPGLASEVVARLQAAGLPAASDARRGYDHGVFVPLKVALPKFDIPVVQMSLQGDLDPALHLAAGRALAPLRDEGVLIIGSGMSWHNMRGFTPAFTAKSAAFDAWLARAVSEPQGREAILQAWDGAPYAREAHPREEHLAPLFVAAGAAAGEPGAAVFRDTVMDVVISGVRFG